MDDTNLSHDILRGADQIATYLGLGRRAVYHAASSGKLPVFHIGSIVHARKSTLVSWISRQEAGQGANDNFKGEVAA